MLKSIKNFMEMAFGRIIEAIAPLRKNLKIVREINEESILLLPPAIKIDELPWVHSLFAYRHSTVRALIWELKYKNNTLPLGHIGKLLFDEILALVSDITLFDAEARFLLIPIPISDTRRSERGYNQAEYICRAIVECDTQHLLLYAPQWFTKIIDTKTQNKSTREERIQNLTGCFNARENVRDQYVILIDDVVTTGSTLREARKTLLEAGAKDVFAFTIAH